MLLDKINLYKRIGLTSGIQQPILQDDTSANEIQ